MYTLELTLKCNNACVFCAQGTLRTTSALRMPDALIADVDRAPAGEPVAFVGGEPTLVDSLPALVRRARERGAPRVLVQTNGRRLGVTGYADELAAAGVTDLEVSLHGSTAAMHDYHTSVPGSFEQTVLGLRRARAAGLPVAIGSVVTRSNFRHLGEIVRLAHALGARAIRLASAEAYGAAATSEGVMPSRAMARPHLERALKVARVLGLPCGVGAGASKGPLAEWFAGLGSVQVSTASSSSRGASSVRRLPLARLDDDGSTREATA